MVSGEALWGVMPLNQSFGEEELTVLGEEPNLGPLTSSQRTGELALPEEVLREGRSPQIRPLILEEAVTIDLQSDVERQLLDLGHLIPLSEEVLPQIEEPLLGENLMLNGEAAHWESDQRNDSLQQAISLATDKLARLKSESTIIPLLQQALGNSWVPLEAIALIEGIISGDRLPEIKIVSGEDLQAKGAFSAEIDTIFLAEEFLAIDAHNPEMVATVLLEEIGHYLDSKLNQNDFPGDEGAILAALFEGKNLEEKELLALKGENDTAKVVLNGQAIEIERSSSEVQPQPLTFGETISGNIAPNRYSFSLASESQLYFDALTYSNFKWSLEGPSGLVVNSRSFTATDGIGIGNPVVKVSAGEYILTIDGIEAGPEYQFRVWELSGATPLNLGTSVSTSLTPARETDLYQFEAKAGERFFFDFQGSTGIGYSYWSLIDPEGKPVFDRDFNSDEGPVTVSQSGSYTLLIEGYIYNSGSGSYSFNVVPVATEATPLTFGETISSTMGQDRYSFSLASESQLYFDALTSSNFRWSLKGPSGLVVELWSFTATDGDGINNPVVKVSAGEYILTIDGIEAGPEYQFRVWELSGATPLNLGTSVSSNLTPARETDLYQFEAKAGERFFFDFQGGTGIWDTYWSLVDPEGKLVFHRSFNSDEGPVTVSQSGSYTLLIEGPIYNSGSGSYSFNVEPIVADLRVASIIAPTAASWGEIVPVEWTIENQGEVAAAGWNNRIYLSTDPLPDPSDTLIGSFSATAQTPLISGESHSLKEEVVIPNGDPHQTWYLLVEIDGGPEQRETDKDNNVRWQLIEIKAPDLKLAAAATAASVAVAGEAIAIEWTVENEGNGAALAEWEDGVYLSDDDSWDPSDSLLMGKAIANQTPLPAGGSYVIEQSVPIPTTAFGSQYLLVVIDREDNQAETSEANNLYALPIEIATPSHADLAVTDVQGPPLTIDDPATVKISWKVTNLGTGSGQENNWVDAVIFSADEIQGNNDDLVIKKYSRSGSLKVGESYRREENILLPPAFSGRYHLFVKTDAEGEVWENQRESNNIAPAGHPLDIMPIPYADLAIAELTPEGKASSGKPLSVSWTVINQGIGLTNISSWTDRLQLARDPEGKQIVANLGDFNHLGNLAGGDSYHRTGEAILPHGLNGTYYLVLQTGGPYEFIYQDNNRLVSEAIEIELTPPPDLQVTEIKAPENVQAGQKLELFWQVNNSGTGEAVGTWTDSIELRSPFGAILLGSFTYNDTLEAGKFYSRVEQLIVPSNLQGSYQTAVTTNSSNSLYEQGATDNNTTLDDRPILLSLPKGADLQIQSLKAPDTVNAGGSVAVEFVVINRGDGSTTTPNWQDKVYLSLDDRLSSDDLEMGKLNNASALAPKEIYATQTNSFFVPKRWRGEVFLIVQTDAHNQVNEYQQENNNTLAVPLNIDSSSLLPSDLVTGNVVAPPQAFAGNTIEVRYSVTNAGIGETDVSSWNDTIWLTRDKKRPSPTSRYGMPGEAEDILLKTISHQGTLKVGENYEQIVTVTLPENISGQWYITPWSDAYDLVLEDTLDININSDDPNELDNNNYKARPITILLPPPADLAVTEVIAPEKALAGESLQVSWTVTNEGDRVTPSSSWVDEIYLSDQPSLDIPGATVWTLGIVTCQGHLEVGESYSQTLPLTLSPAAEGKYIIVQTNVGKGPSQQGWEMNQTDNNQDFTPTLVTNAAADLAVKSLAALNPGISGESVTLEWTVENIGPPMWWGTNYWYDEIWVSPDPTFIPQRATKVGFFPYSPTQPLGTGDSYTQTQEITLPAGLEGDYYIYLSTDYGGDNASPGGDNQNSLESFFERGFENPSNNLAQTYIPIIYREPDLQVTDLVLPETVPQSGETITVSWTVTNTGTRATREDHWQDRIYLSRDPSLDAGDLILAEFDRHGVLARGESYRTNANVPLPFAIGGDFYLLVLVDANLVSIKDRRADPYFPAGAQIYFERGLDRNMARVPEFEDEGNNLTAASLPIIRRSPPDLEVTAVEIPERSTAGQPLKFNYTVSNTSTGDTVPSQTTWSDRIYLSRDEFLDPQRDYYLGEVPHQGGLAAGANYSIEASFTTPSYLQGPFYLFVATDGADGVGEGNQNNNATASQQPLILELAPPSDLQVQQISFNNSNALSGESLKVTWTVANQGENNATGSWTDAIYLSRDAVWDIGDQLWGRVEYRGNLAPGQSYSQTLTAPLPPADPGQYRLIARPDIYNQIYEAENEGNNRTTSVDALTLTVAALPLGVPTLTPLQQGEIKVYQIALEGGETLRVQVTADSDRGAHELFLSYGHVPSGTNYDALGGPIGGEQIAFIPTTEPGTYYLLLKGYSNDTVTILAELLPFGITSVETDRGGDSRYVTADIYGAQFDPQALVKLVRPAIAEYVPANYSVLDSTHIRAIFDLTDAPHGLYDVKVINEDGETAIIPYRYLVERAIEPDVTLGLGGDRVLAIGERGTYGVSVQSLTNIDTPYVHLQFGLPELGDNNFLLGKFSPQVREELGMEALPYLEFNSNLRGQPESESTQDLPWTSLVSEVNTTGEILAPGYIFDLPTRGYQGLTFNAQTYPGLTELLVRQPDALRDLDPGDDDKIAFTFHIQGSATALTRAEFIDRQTQEAMRLRENILADASADVALGVLAADASIWVSAYLAALEEAGLLRPENQAPPVREDPLVVSLMASLAAGILMGPAGEQYIAKGSLIPIRVQKRNFELRFLVWSIKRDKLFRIHSDFENYTLERKLV